MSTYFKESDTNSSQDAQGIFKKLGNYYQAFNDRIQLYKTERWLIVAGLFLFFLIRLIKTGGNLINIQVFMLLLIV